MSIYTLPAKKIPKLPEDLYRGIPYPDLHGDLLVIDEDLSPTGGKVDFDQDLVKQIVDKGLALDLVDTELDAWLAPRLHSAIRVPRRVAGDRGFWAWVAIELCQPYVQHRWATSGVVSRWRYTDTLLRNAVSRLWWGAEMVRNGPDYSDVAVVFRRVRTAQFALELKYSWYRPAAIAFARVAEGTDGGPRLNDMQMKALSVRSNAYLSLTLLESIGGEETFDDEIDKAWWGGSTTLAEVLDDDKLRGPEDGAVPEEVVNRVQQWFRELADEDLHAGKS